MPAAAIAQRRLDKSRSKASAALTSRQSIQAAAATRIQAATRAAAAHAAARQAAQAASAAALAPASPQSAVKGQDRSSSDHLGRDVPPPERHGGGVARRVSSLLGDDDIEAALAARALGGEHSPTSINAALDKDTCTRTAAVRQLQERVAEARFVGIVAVERRVRELAQPAIEQYMADKVNEATLKQRKCEARKKATAEVDVDWPLATLDLAFASFAETVGAREIARLLLTRAEEAELAAEARLVATLEAVEKGAAAGGGPGGRAVADVGAMVRSESTALLLPPFTLLLLSLTLLTPLPCYHSSPCYTSPPATAP